MVTQGVPYNPAHLHTEKLALNGNLSLLENVFDLDNIM
jgi:hypothetical protein